MCLFEIILLEFFTFSMVVNLSSTCEICNRNAVFIFGHDVNVLNWQEQKDGVLPVPLLYSKKALGRINAPSGGAGTPPESYLRQQAKCLPHKWQVSLPSCKSIAHQMYNIFYRVPI